MPVPSSSVDSSSATTKLILRRDHHAYQNGYHGLKGNYVLRTREARKHAAVLHATAAPDWYPASS